MYSFDQKEESLVTRLKFIPSDIFSVSGSAIRIAATSIAEAIAREIYDSRGFALNFIFIRVKVDQILAQLR